MKSIFYYSDGTTSTERNENKILHRVDGPAVEKTNGDKYWYVNGKRHRADGPAEEWADGSKFWFIDDKRYRVDGPAAEYINGTKHWYVDDKLHRLDGPAVECSNGSKRWYINGKLHREDGPTIECSNGSKYWYINDKLQPLADISFLKDIEDDYGFELSICSLTSDTCFATIDVKLEFGHKLLKILNVQQYQDVYKLSPECLIYLDSIGYHFNGVEVFLGLIAGE